MSFQLPNTHTFVLPLVIDFYLLMNIDKEEHMTAKLQVQHLTKIFGRRIQRAEELVKEGKSKAEIWNQLVQPLVSMMPTLRSMMGKSLSSWDYPEAENRPWSEWSTV